MSRRSVFSQVRQSLQWCLQEPTQQQLLFVSQTPFHFRQDKQTDPPDDFPVPLDDPNQDITENGTTTSTNGTSVEKISVQSSPQESSVKAKQPLLLSVSQTPFRLRQHKQPDIDAARV